MLFFQLFYLLLLHQACSREVAKSDPEETVVKIKGGKIRGRRHSTIDIGKLYYAFKGVPYAEPPVGDLRFEPPAAKRNWVGILNTTEERSICVQGENPVQGTEDCLFLSVYTPVVPSTQWTLLPVMVFIHGGGFQAGSSSYESQGPDYFLDQNVVIVTINYRLGIFGFLTTGDLVVPGNNGLKDQVLALKWVQDNIKSFGGDRQKTTAFGQSAGSASVGYLMESDLAQGLFQRAILESGVSLNLWAYSRHGVEFAHQIGGDFKINIQDSQKLVEGLRAVNFSRLQTATVAAMAFKYLTTSAREGFFLAPVVEPPHRGAFLTQKMHEKLTKGQYNKIPFILGYNSLEGTFEIAALLRVLFVKWDLDPATLVPIGMNMDHSKMTEVGWKIKTYYFGFLPAALSNVNVMKFVGDDQFVRPIQEFARQAAKFSKVYLYKFSYEGSLWGRSNKTIPGVSHSEELGYLWRSQFTPTPQDKIVRSRMIKLWTNFAKDGNPTPRRDEVLEGITWPNVNSSGNSDLYCLEIGNNLEVKANPDAKNMKFWTDLYKKYGKPPYDTY